MSKKTLLTDLSLVAANWIAERDGVLKVAERITSIDSDDDLDNSGATYTKIGKMIRALEAERKTLTAPIDAMKKDIMAQEKKLRADLEDHQRRLKRMNDTYATEQARKAEEARKAQEAEEEALRIAEAEKALAADKAREVFGEDIEIDQSTKPEEGNPFEALPPNQVPQPVKPAKPTSNRMRKRWDFEIKDPRKIPREYLTVDEKKIRAAIKYAESVDKEPVIPGVKFTSRVSVEGR